MKRRFSGAAVLVLFASILGGCTGSEEVETTAEHDELSQWVAENPEPEEVDPDAQ